LRVFGIYETRRQVTPLVKIGVILQCVNHFEITDLGVIDPHLISGAGSDHSLAVLQEAFRR
jgi:hypothetical protein